MNELPNLFNDATFALRGSDEVYTPSLFFERLGISFDLDVCAPKGGLPWIPATDHYSIEDD